MFVRLAKKDGTPFLTDFKTGWIVEDRIGGSAYWYNPKLGRNLDCGLTYSQVIKTLTESGMLP